MKLIACVSNDMGILYNESRQTSDDAVIQDVSKYLERGKVLAGRYSAKLFSNVSGISIRDDYLTAARRNDYVFYEGGRIDPEKVDTVILYRWNQDYPSDLLLSDVIDMSAFRLIKTSELKGSSHKLISKVVLQIGE